MTTTRSLPDELPGIKVSPDTADKIRLCAARSRRTVAHQMAMRRCPRERSMRCDGAYRQIRMRGRRAWFNFNLGVESSIDRGSGQSRILSLPTWAGISTLALAPGCCGFNGPVPSATLDKRCWLKQRMQNSKTGSAVKRGIASLRKTVARGHSALPAASFERPAGLFQRTGGNSLAASRIIAIDSRLPHCSN